jgi:hypothetical protein
LLQLQIKIIKKEEKLKRSIFCTVLILSLMAFWGCDDDPENIRVLNIPYIAQSHHTYCAVACLLMWSRFDGFDWTIEEIAMWTGAWDGCVPPSKVVNAIGMFTMSPGYFYGKYRWEPGCQGDLLGAVQEGINQYIPSIMPSGP